MAEKGLPWADHHLYVPPERGTDDDRRADRVPAGDDVKFKE